MATTPHHATSHAPRGGDHAAGGGDGHVHGTMSIDAHERTFGGFLKVLTWSAVLSLAVLVFLALTNA